jgi:acyl carrier protein phosphodiesterase
MNFLAHFYLSGEEEGLLLGNYLGDFLRGAELKSLSPEVERGVQLHRAIDEFTDAHALVRHSQAVLKPILGRYVPVAVDVIYDHFLALFWKEFHEDELQDFANSIYLFLDDHYEHLNDRAKRFLGYMKHNNILYNYQFEEGMRRVFEGLNYRARFKTKLLQAVDGMIQHQEELENDFRIFFPQLKAHVDSFKS